MENLTLEWISVGLITCLAVISPGPDFAMVSKIAISTGRKAGLLCALGIGAGVTVHLMYTMLGLGLLLSQQSWLLSAIKIIGASYLIWLGMQAFWPDLKARFWPSSKAQSITDDHPKRLPSSKRTLTNITSHPFVIGFICNVFNPKTMLFIVALYSQVISKDTGYLVGAGYGVFIALAHCIWFALIASVFTGQYFKQHIIRYKGFIERTCGAIMMAFGLKMISLN
ncbi:LysE family translocator [Marinomonas gallaica]|uniref:LysE family translocator n=1 Tax=Marinomonas gallaica TaxID=1806667 RepID=UPI003A8DB80B